MRLRIVTRPRLAPCCWSTWNRSSRIFSRPDFPAALLSGLSRRMAFGVIDGIQGQGGMGVSAARTHLGSHPDGFHDFLLVGALFYGKLGKIGRRSFREQVCQYV